jgi:uncharacterized membrane protein
MDIEIIYSLLFLSISLLILHFIFVEKYQKKDKKLKKVIIRDMVGSPLHLLFVVGDSFVFIGLFNYLKNLTKNQSIILVCVGIAIMILGIIFYRLLQMWFEKDMSDEEKKERKRNF